MFSREEEAKSGYVVILALVVVAGIVIYLLAAAAIVDAGMKVVNSKWDRYEQYLSGEAEAQSNTGELVVEDVEDKELNNN